MLLLAGDKLIFMLGFGFTKPYTTSIRFHPTRNFVGLPVPHGSGTIDEKHPLTMVTDDVAFSCSSLLIAEESWRQYVPLVVSVLIIIDILLGSPAANAVLAPLRRAEQAEEDGSAEQKTPPSAESNTSLLGKLFGGVNAESDASIGDGGQRRRERIDSDKVAQAAIDKARSTLELKQFLEERKTDWDRMEEMKRKLDSDMQDLDEELEARGRELDEKEGTKQ